MWASFDSGTPALRRGRSDEIADVCVIVEGCYPFVTGGVSSWLDWLMRELPDVKFAVVAVTATSEPGAVRYEFPDNLLSLRTVALHRNSSRSTFVAPVSNIDPAQLAACLCRIVEVGRLDCLAELMQLLHQGRRVTYQGLMNSRIAWETVQIMYQRHMPHSSFLHYFWAWRALFGGLFSMLLAPLPRARLYHTISTGYAGLLAARASLQHGRPAMITEHGIYTNERRIEILMADWIAETLEKGYSITDDRFDLKTMWVHGFESYGRICYDACSKIVTLYEDNQFLQRVHGADEDRLDVIPNGIDWDKFSVLHRVGDHDRPTIALIGRVVPIKDVKTFLYATAKVRQEIPALRALVVGPTDEDEEYYRECRSLVDDLGLGSCVEFTGRQDISILLPQIHVVVLSSISEAQPLVLLEAGAAGIPSVATDVGSCRELIEGRKDESPPKGPGGIVVHVASSDQVADGVTRLLKSPVLRRRLGDAMAERVRQHYNSHDVRHRYRELYAGLCSGAPNRLRPQQEMAPWPA